MASKTTLRANQAAHESDGNAHAALFAAYNASIGALQSDFVQSEWVTPTLLNGATGTIQYRKSTIGRVEFCGTLTVINPGAAVLKMPSEYAPTALLNIGVMDNNAVTGLFRINSHQNECPVIVLFYGQLCDGCPKL